MAVSPDPSPLLVIRVAVTEPPRTLPRTGAPTPMPGTRPRPGMSRACTRTTGPKFTPTRATTEKQDVGLQVAGLGPAQHARRRSQPFQPPTPFLRFPPHSSPVQGGGSASVAERDGRGVTTRLDSPNLMRAPINVSAPRGRADGEKPAAARTSLIAKLKLSSSRAKPLRHFADVIRAVRNSAVPLHVATATALRDGHRQCRLVQVETHEKDRSSGPSPVFEVRRRPARRNPRRRH